MSGLLRRVRELGATRACSAEGGKGRTQQEQGVLEHLGLLLNTQRGGSSLDGAYGLPELAQWTQRIPEHLPRLERLLAETVERYEPRLQQVVVRALEPEPHAAALPFEVRARLTHGPSLRFITRLCQSGHVRIG